MSNQRCFRSQQRLTIFQTGHCGKSWALKALCCHENLAANLYKLRYSLKIEETNRYLVALSIFDRTLLKISGCFWKNVFKNKEA